MATLNTCRKFSANIFDKSKCQNCFKPKETHSAEALECNKIARKISKCAYLFVAPETFDFNNAMDKTRRWQRRFFVLYDDGELTYSVDENVNTVPQGVIDMNVCTNVVDAETITGHEFSICVATDQKNTFIKGGGKEEITRWFDVLVMYPRSLKTTKKHRRSQPAYQHPTTAAATLVPEDSDEAAAKRLRFHGMHAATIAAWDSNQANGDLDVEFQDDAYRADEVDERQSRGLTRSRSDRVVSRKQDGGVETSGSTTTAPETPAIHYRGIRSLKHKHDKLYQDGLKKSSSIHDIPSKDSPGSGNAQQRVRSRSTERFLGDGTRAARRRTVSYGVTADSTLTGTGDSTLADSTLESTRDSTLESTVESTYVGNNTDTLTNVSSLYSSNVTSDLSSLLSPTRVRAMTSRFRSGTVASTDSSYNTDSSFLFSPPNSPLNHAHSCTTPRNQGVYRHGTDLHNHSDTSTDFNSTAGGTDVIGATPCVSFSSCDAVFESDCVVTECSPLCNSAITVCRDSANNHFKTNVNVANNQNQRTCAHNQVLTGSSNAQNGDMDKPPHALYESLLASPKSPRSFPSRTKSPFSAALSPQRANSPSPPYAPEILSRTSNRPKSPGPKSAISHDAYSQLAVPPVQHPIDNYICGGETNQQQRRTNKQPQEQTKPPIIPLDLIGVSLKNKVAETTKLWEDRSRSSQHETLSFGLEFTRRARSAPAAGRNRKRQGLQRTDSGRRTRTPSPPSTRRLEKQRSRSPTPKSSRKYYQRDETMRMRLPDRIKQIVDDSVDMAEGASRDSKGRGGKSKAKSGSSPRVRDNSPKVSLGDTARSARKSKSRNSPRLEKDLGKEQASSLNTSSVSPQKDFRVSDKHNGYNETAPSPRQKLFSKNAKNLSKISSSNKSQVDQSDSPSQGNHSMSSQQSKQDLINGNIQSPNKERHPAMNEKSPPTANENEVSSPASNSKLAKFRSPTKALKSNQGLSALKAKKNAKKKQEAPNSRLPLLHRSPHAHKDPHPVILPSSPPRVQPERRYSVERRPSSGGGEAGDNRGVMDNNVYRSRSPTSSLLLNGRNKNETDEHKMAKTLTRESSSPRQSPSRKPDDARAQDDLKYMKKGWLLKQRVTENDWIKHWFVLSGTALHFYKDSRAEELGLSDGAIELQSCFQINEVPVSRNYGFRLETEEGEFVLSAMTSGIRTNWMQAIQKCVESSAHFGNTNSQPITAQTTSHVYSSPSQQSHSQQSQNLQNVRQASLPEVASQQTTMTSLSQNEATSLSQSYPAVRLRPKTRDTRQRLQQQENRHSLDLSTLDGQSGQGQPEAVNRRLTLDDYSIMARQLETEALKRQDSQDSLQSTQSSESTVERTPRRRRRDKQHKHRISCTWPYESGNSVDGTSGIDPGALTGVDSAVFLRKIPPAFRMLRRSKSELCEYVGQEDKRHRNLSAEDHSDLDHVEKNIRRIHRKSLTDGAPKAPHLEKFENGATFKEPPTVGRKIPLSERILADLDLSPEDVAKSLSHRTVPDSGRERSPSTSSQSSSQSPARTLDATSSPRHMHHSPTHQLKAKVKHRSQQGQAGEDSGGGGAGVAGGGVESVEAMHDMIEQKWREVESSGVRRLSGSAPALTSSSSADTTLRSLLETEVETLKAQLEHTQAALEASQLSEGALQSQLLSARAEREASVTDMDTDQARYVTQMHDIQDQMEHSADFFQSKLQEQENRNEMTKLQVQSLRSQLQEAKDTVGLQQEELSALKARLDTTARELTKNKTIVSEAVHGKQLTESNLQQLIVALEKKVQTLESDIQVHTTSLAQRDHELGQYKDTVRRYAGQLDDKNQRVDSLEAELAKLHGLRQELNEKTDLIGHLGDELEVSKQQLRSQDGVMQKSEKDFNKRVKQMEDEFYREKEKLESTIEQYKARLDQVLTESNMAESNMADVTASVVREKDETIAQLEERVIENDTKLVELKEELGEVFEENAKLQKSLEASSEGAEAARAELDTSRKETARLKNQLSSVNSDVEQMKMKKDALADEKASLCVQIEELQSTHAAHAQQVLDLQQVLADITEERRRFEEELSAKCQECEELQRTSADHAEIEGNLMTSQSDLDLARGRITELESQLAHQTTTTSNATDKQKELEQMREKLAEYARQATEKDTECEQWRKNYSESTREARIWQDQYIELSDECERLREASEGAGEQAGDRVQQLQSELNASQQLVSELQRGLQEKQQSFDKELEERFSEVSESQSLVSELQQKLGESENQYREQTTLLAELREREFLTRGTAPSEASPGDTEIAQKYKETLKDLKQTRMLLQETERKREDLDTFNIKIKMELRTIEMNFEEQLTASKKKVTELTNKLQTSERRLRRLDKRRSSGAPVEDDFKSVNTQTDDTSPRVSPRDQVTSQAPANASSLQRDLMVAKTKIRELSKQLVDTRTAELDIIKLNENESKLKETNLNLEAELVSLRSQLEEIARSEYKDSADIVGRLMEVEGRLKTVQGSLGDCQSKLSSAIGQLRSRGAGEFTSEIVSVNKELSRLLQTGALFDKSLSELQNVTELSESDRTRIFAEKLSLEALVLSELAYNVKINESDSLSSQETVICEIESAKHALCSLQQTVNTLGAQYDLYEGQTSEKSDSLSLERVSQLLSQKLQLSHEISRLVSQEHMAPSIDNLVPHVNDVTSDHLGQDTLFRVFVDEKLQHSSQLPNPVSIYPRTLVHRDLGIIFGKVKDSMAGSLSDKNKQQIEQSELLDSFEWVQSGLSQVDKQMNELMNVLVEHLADLCSLAILNTAVVCQKDFSERANSQVPFHEVLPRVFDPEELQNELIHCTHKLVQNMSPISPMSSSNERYKQRNSLITECIQNESSVLCSKLLSAVEKRLEQGTGQQLKHVMDDDERAVNQRRRGSVACQLCHVIVQRALVNAQITYVHQILIDTSNKTSESNADGKSEFKLPLRRNDSGVVVHSMSLPTSPVTEHMNDRLANSLQQEAVAKSNIASYLVQGSLSPGRNPPTGELKDQIALLACEIIGVDRSLARSHKMVGIYGQYIGREAVLQAQISYSTNLLHLQYQQQLEQLKSDLESSHNDYISNQELHMRELQSNIATLQAEIARSESLRMRETDNAQETLYEIQRKESSFGQEVQALKGSYEIRIRSLQSDFAQVKAELENSQQDRYEEACRQEAHIEGLETELRQRREELERVEGALRDEHQRFQGVVGELEARISQQEEEKLQSKDDVRLAMKAVSSHELEALEDQVTRLRHQLDQERSRHVTEIERLREEISKDTETASQVLQSSKIQQLELQIQNLQADYEAELDLSRSAHRRELARSKDDMLNQLAAAEASSLQQIDEETIRKRYMKEVDRIKEIYDKSFAAMEKSHQKVLMQMRRAHKRELDALRQEKDQVLEEETKATQAALDAMRKAHEAELQKERSKFLDMLAKTYSTADVNSIQRQHEDTLEVLQGELHKLSEQYSVKCLENESLRKRLELQTSMLHDSRKRSQDLIAKNDELNHRLRHDIDKLNRMVTHVPGAVLSPLKKDSDPPEVYDLRVALKLKEAEIVQLKDEMGGHKDQLHVMSQELDMSVEKYSELYDEHQLSRRQLEGEVEALSRRLMEVSAHHSPRLSEPGDSADNLSPESGSRHSDDSPERSPSPKRSRVRDQYGVTMERGAVGGRLLPTVPQDVRSKRQTMWRQRQPERARSNPGPVMRGVLSTPPMTSAPSLDRDIGTSSLDRKNRKKLARIVDVDIIEEL